MFVRQVADWFALVAVMERYLPRRFINFSTPFDRFNLSVIMRLPLKALRLLLGPLYHWRAELFSFSACTKILRLRAQPIVLGKRCDVVSPKTVRFYRTQALGKLRLLIRCRSCIRSQPKQLC